MKHCKLRAMFKKIWVEVQMKTVRAFFTCYKLVLQSSSFYTVRGLLQCLSVISFTLRSKKWFNTIKACYHVFEDAMDCFSLT